MDPQLEADIPSRWGCWEKTNQGRVLCAEQILSGDVWGESAEFWSEDAWKGFRLSPVWVRLLGFASSQSVSVGAALEPSEQSQSPECPKTQEADRWAGLHPPVSRRSQATHGRQSKERNSNQGEGCSKQTSIPGDRELVSIANGC